LVGGQIVGIWEWPAGDDDSLVRWQLFTEVDPAALPFISAEMERTAAFLNPRARAVQG
jgi:hypothetical protein